MFLGGPAKAMTPALHTPVNSASLLKGIVLAGGSGTRLRPATLRTNKHLLPVHGRPMILYAIDTLVGSGIQDIAVVVGHEHVAAFREILGDGRHLGAPGLQLLAQDAPRGVAHALSLAREFAAGARSCVLLADNLIEHPVAEEAAAFMRQPSGARFLLTQAEDPHRHGVATVVDGTLTGIVEKPSRSHSRLVVVGLYFYDHTVFDACASLAPSSRGELEITDVNNTYIARGDASFSMVRGWWMDVGTPESLAAASQLLAETARTRGNP